jgi:hypothetical protein
MRNVLKLRVINLFGAAFFSGYGFLIGALPVALLNGYIAIIDLYFLRSLLFQKEYFDLLPIDHIDNTVLRRFLHLFGGDLKSYFPEFSLDSFPYRYFLMRNLQPVGLLTGQIQGTSFIVGCDYVIPDFRDLKMARFLFGEGKGVFLHKGITKLIVPHGHPKHIGYLKKMGFQKGDNGSFSLDIHQE